MSHCEGGEGGAVFGRETETQNRESGTLVVWEKRMWSLCWLCISCFCLMVVICTYYQLLFFQTHTHTHTMLSSSPCHRLSTHASSPRCLCVSRSGQWQITVSVCVNVCVFKHECTFCAPSHSGLYDDMQIIIFRLKRLVQ